MKNLWKPPANLDLECLELCKSMNAPDGIETFESCCGHGRHALWVWFMWRPPSNGMTILARVMSSRYYGFENKGWEIVLNHTDQPESQICFLLEGPAGTKEADDVAKAILRASDDLGQREYYGQDFAAPPLGRPEHGSKKRLCVCCDEGARENRFTCEEHAHREQDAIDDIRAVRHSEGSRG